LLQSHLTAQGVTIPHEVMILQEKTLKDAHCYCLLHHLSAQQYGALLERYIRVKYQFDKTPAKECKGDLCKNGKYYEIKVSLGGNQHHKFNYVQLRPSHQCDFYLFTAYSLSTENVHTHGELFLFRLTKQHIRELIVTFGKYAHGTVKQLGKITLASVTGQEETTTTSTTVKEYALRPVMGDACWEALLPHRITEEEL